MSDYSKIKVAIYSRKSKLTAKGESIGNQIELCKKYIQTKFPEIKNNAILIYEDEGFSGGNIERPHFKKMMKDAKNKTFNAIVCYRLDRISRNIGDFAKLIEELNSLNISFISIKEQFDTSSPIGRAMMYIASVFSQLERETIAERIRDNMQELSKTGRWLGGTTPLGYISESIETISIEGKKKKACKLKLIEKEAKIVALIFEKFLEFNSLTKTESYFIENNYKTRNGLYFRRFSLKSILNNPTYMIADEEAYDFFIEKKVNLFSDKNKFDGKHGMMVYNRTLQQQGKTTIYKDITEWIVSVGKHDGIISAKNWIQAQNFLQQNKSKTFRKPRSNIALLSGLLFCAKCGNHMRPKLTHKLKNGEQIYHYLCEMKERSKMQKCDIKNPQGNRLDNLICKEIINFPNNDSEFIKQLEIGKKSMIDNEKFSEKELSKLKKELEENKNEINNLIFCLEKCSDCAAEAYIFQRINQLHEIKTKIEINTKELTEVVSNNSISNTELDITLQFLKSFKDNFNHMDVEQKSFVIGIFVKKVVWDGKNVHMFLFGADDEITYPINNFDSDKFEPLCEDSK